MLLGENRKEKEPQQLCSVCVQRISGGRRSGRIKYENEIGDKFRIIHVRVKLHEFKKQAYIMS